MLVTVRSLLHSGRSLEAGAIKEGRMNKILWLGAAAMLALATVPFDADAG